MSDNPENQETSRDEAGRFLPGKSGNPAGRPKGFSIVRMFEEELQKKFLSDEEEIDKARKMVREYIDKTIETVDGQAIRDLADRFDGKPTNKTEVTGANGEPITLKVEFVSGDESK